MSARGCVSVLFGTLMLLSSVLYGLRSPVRAAAPVAVSGTSHYEELLVAVTINGATVSDATMVLKDDRSTYYINGDDLTAWKLVQTNRRTIDHNGQRYFALDDCQGTYDLNRGLLALTAAPTIFSSHVITFGDDVDHPAVNPALRNGSGFVNYDIATHTGSQAAGISGSFNGAFTAFDGVLTASTVQPGNGAGFVRLDTTFERDDLAHATTLRLGDSTEAGGVSPLQRQFGGIQWGTNFALEPSFSTVALPVFSGALPTDGTLDVIVNGRQVSQQEIPAGPFVLQNLPVAAGSGDVTLVLRDAAGHVQNIVSPYYQSPILLRAGVSQFEFDAGVNRQAYGIVSNSYEGTFAALQGRLGLTSRLTLGGAVDASPQAKVGSLATAFLVPAIGQISATLTGRTGTDPGLQQTYAYSYAGSHFSVGGQLMQSSPTYRGDGCEVPCTGTRYQLLANGSVPLGRTSSMVFSYGHSISILGNSSRTMDVEYDRPLGRGRLSLNVLRNGPAPDTLIATATYSMQLGARGWANVSAVRGRGQSGNTVSYSESLPNSPNGVAYQVQAATTASGGAAYTANATEQLTNVTVNQQFFRGQDTTLLATDIAGSIDYVDRSFGIGRTIGQGFGVVEVPGYAGVPIYANGQEVGRTDARGRLVLAQLQPFQTNDISVSAQALPIGVDLVTSDLKVAPFGLSPAVARFAVKSSGGVSLTLVDAHGTVLPGGLTIVGAGKQQWFVALDGLAYLDSVAAGKQHFAVLHANQPVCSFDLVVPADTTQLPDMGRTVCR